MEKKISSWAKHYHKRALVQARFRSKHSTVSDFVTLRVIMEEIDFKGKCYIVVLWASRKPLTPYQGMSFGKE